MISDGDFLESRKIFSENCRDLASTDFILGPRDPTKLMAHIAPLSREEPRGATELDHQSATVSGPPVY